MKRPLFIFALLSLMGNLASADGVLTCDGAKYEFSARVFGRHNGGYTAPATLRLPDGSLLYTVDSQVNPNKYGDGETYFDFEIPMAGPSDTVRLDKNGFKLIETKNVIDSGPCDNLALLGLEQP